MLPSLGPNPASDGTKNRQEMVELTARPRDILVFGEVDHCNYANNNESNDAAYGVNLI